MVNNLRRGLVILAVCLVGCAHDVDWLIHTEYNVIDVNVDDKYFVIPGELGDNFYVGEQIEIFESTENNGKYTIAEITEVDLNTRLVVEEDIPGPTVDGLLRHGDADDILPDPTKVQIVFRTTGELSPRIWYYMVFNFTKAQPNSTAVMADEDRPRPELSLGNRGRNWELYVLFHPTVNGGSEAWTLQRPRLPSTLKVGRNPVDTATGYFNDGPVYDATGALINVAGAITDIAVACRLDNKVQHVFGQEPDLTDPIYYETAADIPASIGAELIAPIRVEAAELTGDLLQDLLVLYAGDDGTAGRLRVLAGDGAGGFTAYGADELITGTPLDWTVGTFNADGLTDVAVLVAGEETNEVQLFYRTEIPGETEEDDPTYEWALSASLPVGDEPVSINQGVLAGAAPDLVVADRGAAGDADLGADQDVARVFINDDAGLFTPGPTLRVTGEITGVALGELFGSKTDVAVSFFPHDESGARETNDSGTPLGAIAVFDNETDPVDFAAEAAVVTFVGDPRHLLVYDTASTSTSYDSVVVVDGVADGSVDETHQTMFILPTTREAGALAWESKLINYLTGALEPSRIELADFNGDGLANDFIICDSADDDFGNRISLFYSLGRFRPEGTSGQYYTYTRHNYSSADIYWTDNEPEPLGLQEWYISHTVGPNFVELNVDPQLFYDLTDRAPEQIAVDFMTGNSPIEYILNENQLGEVLDHLTAPIMIPIETDFENNNQLMDRIQGTEPDEAARLSTWLVDVS
ncbi:hypothetical protein JW859_04330 [bacterium]|nr:hypothetical protein [bacterium]